MRRQNLLWYKHATLIKFALSFFGTQSETVFLGFNLVKWQCVLLWLNFVWITFSIKVLTWNFGTFTSFSLSAVYGGTFENLSIELLLCCFFLLAPLTQNLVSSHHFYDPSRFTQWNEMINEVAVAIIIFHLTIFCEVGFICKLKHYGVLVAIGLSSKWFSRY